MTCIKHVFSHLLKTPVFQQSIKFMGGWTSNPKLTPHPPYFLVFHLSETARLGPPWPKNLRSPARENAGQVFAQNFLVFVLFLTFCLKMLNFFFGKFGVVVVACLLNQWLFSLYHFSNKMYGIIWINLSASWSFCGIDRMWWFSLSSFVNAPEDVIIYQRKHICSKSLGALSRKTSPNVVLYLKTNLELFMYIIFWSRLDWPQLFASPFGNLFLNFAVMFRLTVYAVW